MVLYGLTAAPIPWPMGRRHGYKRGVPAIVLYGALAEAVRRESVKAVCRWFGVCPDIVRKWRRALGVGAQFRPSPPARWPWTTEEEDLVRTLPPREAARRTGRTVRAVYARRFKLALSGGRWRRG